MCILMEGIDREYQILQGRMGKDCEEFLIESKERMKRVICGNVCNGGRCDEKYTKIRVPGEGRFPHKEN